MEATADDDIAEDPAPADAAPAEYRLIGALFGQTPIMSAMEWPTKEVDKVKVNTGSMRIGYIRQGAKVPVLPQPHRKPNCKQGWYELVQGGFVCARYASLDLNHVDLRTAPRPPDLSAPLPYEYAYNVGNGTPLYRKVPTREQRLKFEPWLNPKPIAKPSDDAVEETSIAASTRDAKSVAKSATDPFGVRTEELDAGVPWYLRDYDGGKPKVTLDELKGEGPMVKRMVRGFFVAVDKEITENGTKWLRTTNSLLVPRERVYVYSAASKLQGVWLDDRSDLVRGDDGNEMPDAGPIVTIKPTPDICKPGSKSQVAVVTSGSAKKYALSATRKSVTKSHPLRYHSILKLTGEDVVIDGVAYDEVDEGWWMRRSEGVRTEPGPAPKDLAPGEKWIDINIRTQTLVAYEGSEPVFATAMSSGRDGKQDPKRDHKTPTGTWRIREKHIAATMDGDANAEPYSLDDVPWIQYYEGSYALHGVYWHDSFGRRKSHGCVNLAPLDARALFNWTEPSMPENWHGVWSTADKPGTRVVVHE
ncbi:hypothetical protein AKJ09_01721 [Labilithrix luteola]|uniref:L,D-TPase catalytic domain-containing protein n=1 Tax=Labilithrix luteola TaxID=1391654 RepID=A0A0K1PNG6_9BACT|nr:L,D-transpeptidase [Labilithrix luteola]AKU95057.1 hypothetical protein AKJ09_01721 [Labilithrix luteola]